MTLFRLISLFSIIVLLAHQQCPASAYPSNGLVIRSFHSISRRSALPGAEAFASIGSSANDTSVSMNLESNRPWEEFIMPAPTVITLLGQLMVLSSKTDANLEKNAPIGGFKHMLHPESFRASLVQVSNDGWVAFLNAHENMDKVQLYMQQIPAQVKTAVKIISQASPKLVEKLLPITLNHIDEIARTCVELTTETEKKFVGVTLLLGELLEATVSSQGMYESELKNVTIELEVANKEKEQLDKMAEEMKKRQDDVDAEVKKYRSAYDDALKSIPTGWKALAQDLFRSAIGLVNQLPAIFHLGGGGGGGSGSGGGGTGGAFGGGGQQPDFEKARTLGVVGDFFDQIGRMRKAVTGIFKGDSSTAAKGNPSEMFQSWSVILGSFESMLERGGTSELKSSALSFLQDGKKISEKLQNLFGSGSPEKINDQQKTEVTQDLDDLAGKMQPVVAQGAKASDGMSAAQTGGAPAPGGPSSDAFSGNYGNERFKAYLQLQMLRDAENRYDKLFEQMMKYHEEMKNLVGQMARLNLEEVNYEEIIKLLKEGVKMLTKIKEQWSTLVQFFSLVSVRTKVALNQTLVPFLQYAKEAEDMIGGGGLSKEDRAFFLDTLQEQAVEINKVAYFLYTVSRTYFDVSSKYLLDRLAGIGRMLSTENEAERQQLLGELQRQSDVATDEIKRMAQDRRVEYSQLINARKDELQKYVDQLGGPTEQNVKAVEQGLGRS